MNDRQTAPNVVLVHGRFVDGSGWEPVYEFLKMDGNDLRVVQNPTLSLEGDVAATNQIIDASAAWWRPALRNIRTISCLLSGMVSIRAWVSELAGSVCTG
jgi:hypothetical protein